MELAVKRSTWDGSFTVYRYGTPRETDFDEAALEQLHLAHDVRNAFVAIEHSYGALPRRAGNARRSAPGSRTASRRWARGTSAPVRPPERGLDRRSPTAGRYEPVICSPLPSANVVAAHDIGALAMWRRPYNQPRYALRVDGPDGLAAFTTGPSAVGLRFAVPTITFTDDPYSRLRFDMALPAAESDQEAQHCMVKGGLPTALIDAETAEIQESRWREAVPHEARYIELHHEVRERRRRAFKSLTFSRSAAGSYRDIITTKGVLRYIEHGDPGGGAFGGKYLDIDERIAQTHQLADVVENRPKYELALVERRELLVPVDKNWWAAVRGVERDFRGVFFVASRRQDDDEVQERQGWLSDSGSTKTVDAFFALFQLMWDILPAETKDAPAVAAKLRALADHGEPDSR